MNEPKRIRVKLPAKLGCLLTPAPVKVVYGGRGKGASWSIARSLLLLGEKRKLFIVCAREIQKSIKDSVHKLLADQIELLGMNDFYDVLDVEIRGKNGTIFSFEGLNNINSFRSKEAIDILWVTEANHVPKSKWTVLFPTVRRDPPFGPFKQGSEVWVDFNPELSSDDTYMMFVVKPPTGAIVVEMNYRDNPFFPEILRRQMLDMRRDDYDEYLTVWEGKTRKALSGAIYVNEMRAAIQDGRINPRVKHDKSRGVIAVFDLGDSDMCTCWVFQQIGMEHNAIFYMEDSQRDISYFIHELQDRGYLIKGLWLPHDARQAHQSARKLIHNTIEKQAKAMLPTPGIVKIIPNVSEANQISAARMLFPRMNIHEIECSGGVLCLQHYQFEVDTDTKQRSKKPKHNWASHGAKSFGYYAVQLKEGHRKEANVDTDGEFEKQRVSKFGNSSTSWMSI